MAHEAIRRAFSPRTRIGVVLAAALLMTGCAAGRDAQTAYQRPTLDGTEATLGTIALRALSIETPLTSTFYAPGRSAPVRLVLVNSGTAADQLTSVTSPYFSGWGAFTSASQAQGALDGTGTGDAGSSASTAPGGAHEVTVTANARVSWGTPDSSAVLVLTNFRKPAYPGSSVPITFTFAKAGSITVRVPVALSNGPNASVIPSTGAGD